MAKIHYIKNPPFKEIPQYYHAIFDSSKDQCNYTFKYYWYFASEQRIWGCEVCRNGKLYDCSRQLSLSEIRECLNYE